MSEIIIDPEFRDLIDPLTPEELDQLHRSITAHGCVDPLRIWRGKGILLDGHNRFAYCVEHGIEFDVKEITCSTRQSAMNFIILNQLGRRNLDPKRASLLRGKLYNGRKQSAPNPEGAGGKGGKIVKAQNEHQQTTAQKVAAETGVSRETVKRDAKYGDAAETLGDEFDISESKSATIAKAEAKLEGEGKKPAKSKRPKRKTAKSWWMSAADRYAERFKELEFAEQEKALSYFDARITKIRDAQ